MKVLYFTALGLSLAFTGYAGAQTLSPSQAWQQCLAYVDQIAPRQAGDQSNDQQRTFQFKSCMEKLGHN